MTAGSIQMQRYLSARRQERTMMTACVESGISVEEARLIEADIARDPSMLAAPQQSTPAPVEAQIKETPAMGRPKKKDTPINGEVPKPDFDHAAEIYTGDIQPANKAQKQAMKDASDGWKAVKKDARVHVAGYRTAMKVAEMEDAEQQAWLRSFNGGLGKRGVVLHADLADQAGGIEGDRPPVPTGERPKPQLATVPKTPPPDGETALAEAAE